MMVRRCFGVFPIALATAFALSGCATQSSVSDAGSAPPSDCAGVSVTVDFATLGPAPIETCVDVSAEASAIDVLNTAGITIDGTTEYGDAVACRVNGIPAVDTPIHTQTGTVSEDCTDMPSADAYWSVWVRQHGVWDYAQVGLGDLSVRPGEGIGLLFDINNAAVAPTR